MATADRDHDDETPSPWHKGERAAQARVGVRDRMELTGRHVIRSFMPEQHRVFLTRLPFILVGSLDHAGLPWASLLSGPPGFARSPHPRRLDVRALPAAGDPLHEALRLDAPLGVLGIELPTRRRNRVNGHVVASDERGFSLAVDQSFGNCPQYIHRRDYAGVREGRGAPKVEPFATLDTAARELILRADTFFVASAAADEGQQAGQGVDVSHRGGQPGFLDFDSDGSLLIPDFRGNRFFNTLGNLMVNPRAGLLFPDFERGDLLQFAGDTEILWEGPEVRAFRGAERLWRVRPSHGRWLRGALPLRLVFREISPQSLRTGTWREANAAQGTLSSPMESTSTWIVTGPALSKTGVSGNI
jgi:uncharacterized protein